MGQGFRLQSYDGAPDQAHSCADGLKVLGVGQAAANRHADALVEQHQHGGQFLGLSRCGTRVLLLLRPTSSTSPRIDKGVPSCE